MTMTKQEKAPICAAKLLTVSLNRAVADGFLSGGPDSVRTRLLGAADPDGLVRIHHDHWGIAVHTQLAWKLGQVLLNAVVHSPRGKTWACAMVDVREGIVLRTHTIRHYICNDINNALYRIYDKSCGWTMSATYSQQEAA